MNRFNRIFTIVSLIFLTIFGAAILLVPQLVANLVLALGDSVTGISGGTAVAQWAVRILLALVYVGLLGLVLWTELRQSGVHSILVMRSTGSGKLRVSVKAIQDRVKEGVNGLSGVISTDVVVNARKNALALKLDVLTAHGTDLVLKGEEVVGMVRNIVQEQLGLKLFAKPDVTLKAAPAPRLNLSQLNILRRDRREPEQLPPARRPSADENADIVDGEATSIPPTPSTNAAPTTNDIQVDPKSNPTSDRIAEGEWKK